MLHEATPKAKKKHGITAGVYAPTFEEVMEFSETLQKFLSKYPKVKEHVKALHGEYRSCSRHAGGVVIAPSALTDFSPIYCDESGSGVVTQYDKSDEEYKKKFNFSVNKQVNHLILLLKGLVVHAFYFQPDQKFYFACFLLHR